ncbi:MAG: ribosomal RNA small subunit methyltransferase A [Asgard group archaeon]|nr:ribosomal RNA small subunit methyltransferase A [Asgard group archaeon]
MSDLIIKTRDALLAAGTVPKKSLSQNFLINKHLLEKQIAFAAISSEDIILEIGGGTGLLTEELAKKAKHVYCIEYDKNLAQFLREKFKHNEKIEIIEGDVLKLSLPKANKIIANLPYHISSPITFKLLDHEFELAILMYQHEFAKRMVAKPKTEDYSRLSANLQYQSEVEILQRIPRKAFYPMPKVDSALVKITLKKEKPPIPVKHFRITTRILFNTKNKLVSAVFYEYFKRFIEKTERIPFKKSLNEIKYSSHRVRELSIEELVVITRELVNLLEKEQKITLLK